MRINGRTWPAWACAAATLWFVAITVFWATRPLEDRVPTTVAAPVVVGQPPPAPGARAEGPTVEIECGAPAETKITDAAANRAELAALVDKSGNPLNDPRFARSPCIGFHHQSRILWFVDAALYAIALVGLGTVVLRRRRAHLPPALAAA